MEHAARGRAEGSPGATGLRASSLLLLAATALAAAGCVADLPLLVAEPEEYVGTALPPAPPGGYDLDRPYPLLPGDRVSVTVREDPELNIDLEIPPDGVIEVYKSDKDGGARERLTARGMTVTELKEAIADVYQRVRFSFRPYVQVSLVSAVPRNVYIRGAIDAKGTGALELPKGTRMTLYRALQAVGGLQEDSDLTRVRISRRDPATGAEVSLPPYDLVEMRDNAAYDRDPPLEPNDIITVPTLGRVSIFGNINSPGKYLCRKGMTLTELIAEAGGLKPFSKLRDVRVIRNEGTGRERYFRVDVGAILDGTAPYDPLMAPGDRVYIDEDWK